MLTTGVQLRGQRHGAAPARGELRDGSITALGLGVGISLARVPRALLQEAERRDFPIFVGAAGDAVPGDHLLRQPAPR